MYIYPNIRTKKALKELVESGRQYSIILLTPWGEEETFNGRGVIEGPHYPEPHRFYADVVLEDGKIIKIDGKRINKKE